MRSKFNDDSMGPSTPLRRKTDRINASWFFFFFTFFCSLGMSTSLACNPIEFIMAASPLGFDVLNKAGSAGNGAEKGLELSQKCVTLREGSGFHPAPDDARAISLVRPAPLWRGGGIRVRAIEIVFYKTSRKSSNPYIRSGNSTPLDERSCAHDLPPKRRQENNPFKSVQVPRTLSELAIQSTIPLTVLAGKLSVKGSTQYELQAKTLSVRRRKKQFNASLPPQPTSFWPFKHCNSSVASQGRGT